MKAFNNHNKLVKTITIIILLLISKINFANINISYKNLDDAHTVAYLDQESLEDYQERKEEAKDENNKKADNDNINGLDNPDSQGKDVEIQEVGKDKKKEDVLDAKEREYNDPFEEYNRFMYGINKSIDRYTLKPIANAYNFIMPPPANHMVSNFFSNVQDITVLINNILQLDYDNTVKSMGRLIINTSIGIIGLIDVAADLGLPKNPNDYGVTFGKWGMEDSPYFVIPLLGPSTIRDTLGKGIGFVTSVNYFFPEEAAWPLVGLYVVDTRADLIVAEKIIETVSDEEYVFVRNSYMQYRDTLIAGEKNMVKREEQEEKLIDTIVDNDETAKGFDDKLKKLKSLSEDLLKE